MAKPYICQIAINSPVRKLFDYTADLDQSPQVGQRVEISFGPRKVVGIICNVTNESELPTQSLKAITRFIDTEPSISQSSLAFVQWAAQYYQHPLGEALFHALPTKLRTNKPLNHRDLRVWKTTEKGQVIDTNKLGRAVKQIEALKLLQKTPKGLGQKTCSSLGISSSALKGLEKKLYIELIESTQSKTPDQQLEIQTKTNHLRSIPLKLNEEQSEALAHVIKNNFQHYECFLLNGITGSGKTELYLQAIAHCLSLGKQALVLVPEIGLTPQTLQSFQRRFNCELALMHSGLSENERFNSWHKAKMAKAPIVIGTRSAIFVDLPALGLIVVDEEHDLSYKQQEGFRYSARDLAVVRARKENIPIILGTATPAFESLHNSDTKRYQELTLSKRANQAQTPKIAILDIRGLELQGGLSHKVIHAIRRELELKQQVLIYINRRGYTPSLICPQCLWTASCPYCDARFTFHKAKDRLLCHHCGFQQAPINTCPKCKEGELQALGQGTEKVEEVLEMHFKNTPVIRIDRDSTQKKNAFQQQLSTIKQSEPCILVGTQMLAKGHHFPRVNLVCIIDFDQGFYSSDFRALERMAQTLIQISGRAGRESQQSKVIVQTQMPDHPALLNLIKHGYRAFADTAMEDRKLLNFPPFAYLVLIRAEALSIEQSLDFLNTVKSIIGAQSFEPAPRILGPAPATMQKRAGQHRAQLLLHHSSRRALQKSVQSLCIEIAKLPNQHKLRWSIDVDPMETF